MLNLYNKKLLFIGKSLKNNNFKFYLIKCNFNQIVIKKKYSYN